MANMPSVDLRFVGYRLPISLAVKVEKLAKAWGVSMNQAVVAILRSATEHIELSSADYQRIKEEVARNEAKRRNQ